MQSASRANAVAAALTRCTPAAWPAAALTRSLCALSALSLRSLPLSIGLVVKSFSHYNLSLLLLLLLLSFCGFWLHPKTYNNNDDGSSSNYIVYAVIERQANKTLSSLAVPLPLSLPLPLPLSCSLVLALVFGSFAAKSRIGKLVLVFGRAKCMTF